jgi:hypothetical protein
MVMPKVKQQQRQQMSRHTAGKIVLLLVVAHVVRERKTCSQTLTQLRGGGERGWLELTCFNDWNCLAETCAATCSEESPCLAGKVPTQHVQLRQSRVPW